MILIDLVTMVRTLKIPILEHVLKSNLGRSSPTRTDRTNDRAVHGSLSAIYRSPSCKDSNFWFLKNVLKRQSQKSCSGWLCSSSFNSRIFKSEAHIRINPTQKKKKSGIEITNHVKNVKEKNRLWNLIWNLIRFRRVHADRTRNFETF